MTIKAKVASDGLNVRRGPGSDFGLVDQLKRGDDVEFLKDPIRLRNGWAEVRVLSTNKAGDGVGETGWVWAKNLAVLPDLPDVPAAPPFEPAAPEPMFPARLVLTALGLGIIISVAWVLWWRPLMNVVYP